MKPEEHRIKNQGIKQLPVCFVVLFLQIFRTLGWKKVVFYSPRLLIL